MRLNHNLNPKGMKKNLLTSLMVAALLSPLTSYAGEIMDVAKATMPAPAERAAAMAPVQSQESEDGQLQYQTYDFYVGNTQFYTFRNSGGEGTHLEFKEVRMRPGDYFMLQSFDDGAMFYAKGETKITDDNLTCELYYYSPAEEMWDASYGLSDVRGYYDISVDFDGKKATLTFTKAKELGFTPAYGVLNTKEGASASPYSTDGNKVTYTDLTIDGDFAYYIQDINSGIQFGWAKEDETPATPENPSSTLVVNPDFFALAKGLKGTYNVTIEYSEDFKSATVSFAEANVPDLIANYTGDLYINGAISGLVYGVPEFKMTCKEPGIFEWSGEKLTSDFFIGNATPDTPLPDTDICIKFGANNFPEVQKLEPGVPVNLKMGGPSIYFGNENFTIEKPHVTVNLKEMTLLVEGTLVHPELKVDNIWLYTNGWDQQPQGEVVGNEMLFKDIEFDENMESVNPYVHLENSYIIYNFGWPMADYQDKVTADKDNSVVTLPIITDSRELGFLKVNFKGVYDIYISLTEDQMAVKVRFVSKDDGVDDASEDMVKIARNSDGIVISGAEAGADISVYTVDGKRVYGAPAAGANVAVSLEKGALYIIRVADKAYKVQL